MSSVKFGLAGFVLASVMLLASCGATRGYAGEKRPSSETAILIGMSPWSPVNLGTATRVTKVDGAPVEGGTRIELLPGKHRLEIYASHSFGSGTREVEVELEAGQEYLIAMATDPEELFVIVPNGER